MSLPLLRLQPISISHYQISGDVSIADGAAIAPGVLIQAEPNSRIVIKSGACIGVGSILHASNGVVEIGEGANIGAEVLLIGQVRVGDHACIGTASTILNTSIESGQVIPPGSLIGDSSRQTQELQATDTVVVAEPAVESTSNHTTPEVSPTSPVPPSDLAKTEDSATSPTGVKVYGQMYVNNMFVKLFPNQKPASEFDTSDKLASSDDPWND
ncbi:MAG TPA: hypothetical protein IGS53_23515 [Leptolyngbyaceae cyanobacterium M33_DOE_097]|uniref:Transferase n=1 Tax=Oscillatoriales cyanobacterium SpSt-418 TaxID=2282169 RepID=A0A7C3PCF4_9CYAN|nr:hypothetical protein [Leptolyngbyaceae cyanobacterium M33_DOE_097]